MQDPGPAMPDEARPSPSHALASMAPPLPAGPKRARPALAGSPTSDRTRLPSPGPVDAPRAPSVRRLDAEPPLKRLFSSLPEDLPVVAATDDAPSSDRPAPSWAEWTRLRAETGIRSVSKQDNFYTAGDMPAMAQRIVAFPLQFGFSTGGPSSSASTGANQAGGGSSERNLMDPALSSMRSSADQAVRGPNVESSLTPDAPGLEFHDETLHSATHADSSAVLEAALQHAAAESGDPDAGVGVGVGVEDHDMSRLAPPATGDAKKEQPFSRSPELRISHKMAERKRRKEMKDMFDELRELLPADRGSKSSKWEILSKAIDHITFLKNTNQEQQRELDRVRRELEVIRGGAAAGYPYPSYNPSFLPNPPAAYPPAQGPAPAVPAPVAPSSTAPPAESESAPNEAQGATADPAPAPAAPAAPAAKA